MSIFLGITLVFLAISVLFNLHQFRASKKKPKQESYDVRELLHDLTGGEALVRVSRVAPADVFLRSPRGNT